MDEGTAAMSGATRRADAHTPAHLPAPCPQTRAPPSSSCCWPTCMPRRTPPPSTSFATSCCRRATPRCSWARRPLRAPPLPGVSRAAGLMCCCCYLLLLPAAAAAAYSAIRSASRRRAGLPRPCPALRPPDGAAAPRATAAALTPRRQPCLAQPRGGGRAASAAGRGAC